MHAHWTETGPSAGDLLAEMARQEKRVELEERNRADDVTSGDVWPLELDED